jgi:hypothetical protein
MKWAAFFFFSPLRIDSSRSVRRLVSGLLITSNRTMPQQSSRNETDRRKCSDPPGQFAGRFFESSKVFHAAPPSAAPPRHRSRGRQHIHDDSFQSSLLHCQANGPRVRSIVGTSTPRRSHRWRWMALPSLWENEEQLTPGRSARWNLGPVCPLSDAAQH